MASNTTDRVGVVIGTYGDLEFWRPLAERALASVKAQTVVPGVVWNHQDTLAEARNGGADMFCGWVENYIFLDADDELDGLYVESMLTGAADIRQPSTVGVRDGVVQGEPNVIPPTDLRFSNYLVVGSMVRAEAFHEAKGFADLPALEDWDLWGRLVLAHGATVETIPDAVYKIHFMDNSRNNTAPRNSYRLVRRRLEEACKSRSLV